MGIVTFSIPKDLVLRIVKDLHFDNFIETGTYKGVTVLWAANYFPNAYTIEIDETLAADFRACLQSNSNIQSVHGDSRTVLPDLLKKISGRSFCWLDGHWCCGAGGQENECPIFEELKALSTADRPMILIDDARCFIGPMPPPHNYKHWPRIHEIFNFIQANFKDYTTTILDDVILAMPPDVLPIMDAYWMSSFNERFYGPLQSVGASPSNSLRSLARKIKSIVK
jgi:hypothetical protein